MGLLGDMLVFITASQYDITNKEKFQKLIEAFLDYSVWKMATYIYFNNGFECIRQNAQKLLQYPLVYEFLKKSAVENYRLQVSEDLSLEELMKILEGKRLESWLMPDACGLFKRLLDRKEDPVLLADAVVHFQHTTGSLFGEDVEGERDYAERTIELIFE